MKRFKIFIAGMAVMFLGIGALPALSYADPAADTTTNGTTSTQAACAALGSADCTDTSGGPSLNKLIATTLNILSVLIAIIAIIMIIISGLRYVTSGGDSNATSSARNTLIYAVVGLVIVALAQFIVQFVLHRLTSK